jgi:hypothetical protein
MSGLVILSAPPSGRRKELTRWIRKVGQGAAQLAQEAACDPKPDGELVIAMAWLANDLAAVAEAAADFVDHGKCELDEAPDGFARIDEMRRLLRVGIGVFGDSTARTFVAASIAERMEREVAQSDGSA